MNLANVECNKKGKYYGVKKTSCKAKNEVLRRRGEGESLLNGVLFLFLISNTLYFFQKKWPHSFVLLCVIFAVQFALYGFLAWGLYKKKTIRFSLILVVAIFSRLTLSFSEPILENDYIRYLWDGRVVAHGFNPYKYKPMDKALDHLKTDYREKIGWKQYKTIYPPLAQMAFGVSHLIGGDSLLSLKWVFILFDLGTGILLCLWLSRLKKPKELSLLYFLNPLVLKEISNSAHLDSMVVFFSVFALYLFSFVDCGVRQSFRQWLGTYGKAWAVLALAIASKFYPLVFVPLVMRLDKKWTYGVSLIAVIMAVLYLPFLSAGENLFSGLGAYSKYWIWNASIFQLTTKSLNWTLSQVPIIQYSAWLDNLMFKDIPAKVVVGVIYTFIIWSLSQNLKKKEDLGKYAMWAIGALLVLSPVVDGWYVLWILPLACLYGNLPWLSFSFLVVGSYAWFYSKDFSPWIKLVEYLLFYLILMWTYRNFILTKWSNAIKVKSTS